FIAVSEGIHDANGKFISEYGSNLAEEKDAFGHAQLGGLAVTLADELKRRTGAKVRGIELSLLQRCGAHLASKADVNEAVLAGKTAVEAAVSGDSGKMVAFERGVRCGKYTCKTKLIPLESVANLEKKVPLEWIVPEGNNVTQDFIDYALPLIQGQAERVVENSLPRYAKLKKVLAK
ncbi:MAG: 6-phosphofructokinase, partial [Oscillospiraceae bacterium]